MTKSHRTLAVAALFAGALPLAAHAVPMNYTADLGELNGSGVTGQADLTLDGSTLDVAVEASGLVPGRVHVQHIHGRFDDGTPINSVSPPATEPAGDPAFDGDGFVELEEGAPFYGPIILNLDDGVGDGTGAFPTAPDGTVSFSNTYELSDQLLADLTSLDLREIVLHGAFAPAEVNDRVGEDGYLATLPVASGVIAPAPIPVPAAGVLLVGALGGLGAMRLRRGRA